MSHYTELWSKGGGSDPELNIYLYPNTKNDLAATKDGGTVAEAIRNGADQIYYNTNVGSYTISRFKADYFWYNYSELSWSSTQGGIWMDNHFGGYLNDKNDEGPTNGTGRNLRGENPGIHHLVHSLPSSDDKGWNKGCYGFQSSSSSADMDDGAGAYLKNSAWGETGDLSWSPVCGYDDLTRNAAIQEMTHLCLDFRSDPSERYSNGDDHAHGTISTDTGCSPYYNCKPVSPMSTYHWDESPQPNCDPEHTTADSHDQSMTSCVFDRIDDTLSLKGL